MIPGRVEVVSKFNQLPQVKPVEHLFHLQWSAAGKTLSVTVRSKTFRKIKEAPETFKHWVCRLTASLATIDGKTLVLHQASPQIVEKILPEGELPKVMESQLSVVLSFSQFPHQVIQDTETVKSFVVQAGDFPVKVSLTKKSYLKLKKNTQQFSHWVVKISGKLGPTFSKTGFELLNPIPQVFEKQAKNPTHSKDTSSVPPVTVPVVRRC